MVHMVYHVGLHAEAVLSSLRWRYSGGSTASRIKIGRRWTDTGESQVYWDVSPIVRLTITIQSDRRSAVAITFNGYDDVVSSMSEECEWGNELDTLSSMLRRLRNEGSSGIDAAQRKISKVIGDLRTMQDSIHELDTAICGTRKDNAPISSMDDEVSRYC